MTWQQDEIGCVRSLDQKKMLSSIRLRMDYEQRKYNSYQPNPFTEKTTSKFTPKCRDNLESIRVLLAAEKQLKKVVFFSNFITVYSNNLALYDQLLECNWIKSVSIKQAQLDLLPNTIMLKTPQHQYRTYLRGQKMVKSQKDRLASWIATQGNEIAASKSLQVYLSFDPSIAISNWWRHETVESYYYVEHNSLQYETMLSMVCPGLVRKTFSIVKKQ